MKKLVLAGMLLAIVFTVGTTAGFDLAGGEANQPPVPSAEGLDPDPCNIAACDGGGTPQLHPSPPDEGLDPDVCNIDACDGGGTPQLHPVRSDEGLDPDVCNEVHKSMLASLRTCALA